MLHILASVFKLTFYENTDFGPMSQLANFFSLVESEWTSPVLVDITLSRDRCDSTAFERTWRGVTEF